MYSHTVDTITFTEIIIILLTSTNVTYNILNYEFAGFQFQQFCRQLLEVLNEFYEEVSKIGFQQMLWHQQNDHTCNFKSLIATVITNQSVILTILFFQGTL